ncbi:hypothetical protein ABZZ20_24450 [Streptomyces sp. NPDC006430]|uniref:RipA family octameric membrane protein n=1 Tax=Streptomyces sp. NPDC006430 TaxID=3154299 RepID=UPI0033B64EFA
MTTHGRPQQAADSQAWLSQMYAIAWQQYMHEDSLGQMRNSVFLAANAALVAVLAAVSPSLADMDPIVMRGRKFYIGLAILGLLAIVIGVFSIGIASHWGSAIKAGRAYVNLRHAVARAIEEHVNVPPIALAQVEHRWREFSMSTATGEFVPFPDIFSMSDVRVRRRPKVSGWESILRTAKIVSAMGYVMCVSGTCLLIGVYILATKNP